MADDTTSFNITMPEFSVFVRDPHIPSEKCMMECVTMAAMEGFEGFGVWHQWTLNIPPILDTPPSESVEETQLTWTEMFKRVSNFYYETFIKINFLHAGNPVLPFIPPSEKLGKFMVECLVDGMAKYLEHCSCAGQDHCHPKSFDIVRAEGAILNHLIIHLKAKFHRSFPQIEGLSNQSLSADHPEESSSQSVPVISSAIQRPAYSRAFMVQTFFEGGYINLWNKPQDVNIANVWGIEFDGKFSEDSSQNSHGVNPPTGEAARPPMKVQYFYMKDSNSSNLMATYISVREAESETMHTSHIARCWYMQCVSENYFNSRNQNIYFTILKEVSKNKKCSRVAAKVPQPGNCTSSTSSAMDGVVMIAKDCSQTSASDQASSAESRDQGALQTEIRADKCDDEHDTHQNRPGNKCIEESDKTCDGQCDDQHDDTDNKFGKECVICLAAFKQPVRLRKCGHVFCRQCVELCFESRLHCPLCRAIVGVVSGNMPNGFMTVFGIPDVLPGYEGYNSIAILYRMNSGIQKANHPNPGVMFTGTFRIAFLPATEEGFKVCRLLWVAFMHRLTFTVGRSVTTGRDNVVTWNDIHHKTNRTGGPENFGYPDLGYLSRVTEELALKGITEEYIQGFRIPF